MTEALLIINSGSSSIKFSLFTCEKKLNLVYRGEVEGIEKPCLTILDANYKTIVKQNTAFPRKEAGLSAVFNWLEHLPESIRLKAVGHRVVHGGNSFSQPTLVNHEVIREIRRLSPIAPFHIPNSLKAIEKIQSIYPKMPQVLCFDTAFHRTQDRLATLFALPSTLTNEGLIRYGFHGISYEYIASVMGQYIGDASNKRVIVAHLGNGASMCAMYQGKSVATSMGFTALDGLMMGSRSGSIDPGLILYLLQEKKCSVEHVSTLLYQESGLLGVSGISHDMRILEASSEAKAIEAVDLFCYIAVKELGALCAQLQGCDALIFTAGIGEHSAKVRKKICDRLAWLGVLLNEQANQNNVPLISDDRSNIIVAVIPTHEEYMIAKQTMDVILAGK